jgi:hypothetical protein
MGLERWRELEGWQRDVLQQSIQVWEAALAEEIRASEAVGRTAGGNQITYSKATPQEQQRFDAAYQRDAEVNARALERFGIDGMHVLRIARGSIRGRSQIQCGDS